MTGWTLACVLIQLEGSRVNLPHEMLRGEINFRKFVNFAKSWRNFVKNFMIVS